MGLGRSAKGAGTTPTQRWFSFPPTPRTNSARPRSANPTSAFRPGPFPSTNRPARSRTCRRGRGRLPAVPPHRVPRVRTVPVPGTLARIICVKLLMSIFLVFFKQGWRLTRFLRQWRLAVRQTNVLLQQLHVRRKHHKLVIASCYTARGAGWISAGSHFASFLLESYRSDW